MSRVYFHSPSGGAELRGSERAHMGIMISDLAAALLTVGGLFGDEGHALFRVLPHFHREDYSGFGSALRFREDIRVLAAVSNSKSFRLPDGSSPGVFTVCLNTALAIGNDQLKLFARLHGQCEIHAWVDGPNRAWLAGIIDGGRASGMFRSDQGWEAVSAFLRESDTEPVVTSYSVCSQFPNMHVAGWTDEHDGDDFYDLPSEKQWELGMAALREQNLEMRPDLWSFTDYYFGSGETAFSVLEAAAAAPVSA